MGIPSPPKAGFKEFLTFVALFIVVAYFMTDFPIKQSIVYSIIFYFITLLVHKWYYKWRYGKRIKGKEKGEIEWENEKTDKQYHKWLKKEGNNTKDYMDWLNMKEKSEKKIKEIMKDLGFMDDIDYKDNGDSDWFVLFDRRGAGIAIHKDTLNKQLEDKEITKENIEEIVEYEEEITKIKKREKKQKTKEKITKIEQKE